MGFQLHLTGFIVRLGCLVGNFSILIEWILCFARYQMSVCSPTQKARHRTNKSQQSTNKAPIKPRSHSNAPTRGCAFNFELHQVGGARNFAGPPSRFQGCSLWSISASQPPTRLAFASLPGRDPRLHISAQLHRVNISDNELSSAAAR